MLGMEESPGHHCRADRRGCHQGTLGDGKALRLNAPSAQQSHLLVLPVALAWRKCSVLLGFTWWHMMVQLKQKQSQLGNPDCEVTVSTATAVIAMSGVAQNTFSNEQGYLHHCLQKSWNIQCHHWRPEEENPSQNAVQQRQHDQLLPLQFELSLQHYTASAFYKEHPDLAGQMRPVTCSLLPLCHAVLKA